MVITTGTRVASVPMCEIRRPPALLSCGLPLGTLFLARSVATRRGVSQLESYHQPRCPSATRHVGGKLVTATWTTAAKMGASRSCVSVQRPLRNLLLLQQAARYSDVSRDVRANQQRLLAAPRSPRCLRCGFAPCALREITRSRNISLRTIGDGVGMTKTPRDPELAGTRLPCSGRPVCQAKLLIQAEMFWKGDRGKPLVLLAYPNTFLGLHRWCRPLRPNDDPALVTAVKPRQR